MRYLIPIFMALLLSACLPPTAGQPPMGERYLGTFEAVGATYHEVLRIYEDDGLRYEHTFHQDGVLVVKESGRASVNGYSIVFHDNFSECVNSETAEPHPQPASYLNFSLLLLREGEPEIDRLLPFAEHPYNLAKTAGAAGTASQVPSSPH